MKMNHNNRDLDIDYDTCSNCHFYNITHVCVNLNDRCWFDNLIYKTSTKNSNIFNI